MPLISIVFFVFIVPIVLRSAARRCRCCSCCCVTRTCSAIERDAHCAWLTLLPLPVTAASITAPATVTTTTPCVVQTAGLATLERASLAKRRSDTARIADAVRELDALHAQLHELHSAIGIDPAAAAPTATAPGADAADDDTAALHALAAAEAAALRSAITAAERHALQQLLQLQRARDDADGADDHGDGGGGGVGAVLEIRAGTRRRGGAAPLLPLPRHSSYRRRCR